jgi:hypothetical protein
MYLVRAEASARNGDEATALDDLNTLREGHRFFDLKDQHAHLTDDCNSFCTLDPAACEWTWPIPQPEVDANPNIFP